MSQAMTSELRARIEADVLAEHVVLSEAFEDFEAQFNEESEMATTQPSKEVVREWLHREVSKHRPPPDIKQIRRELGWGLEEAAHDANRPRYEIPDAPIKPFF
jgi:hypothetical protein